MEYEFERLLPKGMSLHATRIAHTCDSEPTLLHMLDELEPAATLLKHARVDAICFGCTASGFVQSGVDRDKEVTQALSSLLGIPVIATSDAVARALQHLDVRRIAVASPYEPWLNAHLRRYLEGRGFTISDIAGFGTQEHAKCSPHETLELAMSVVRPDAQAIFLSCANLRTLEIIEPLERATGLPVVTSTQAAMWHMLRLLSYSGPIGPGRLLSEA
ncbi:maleate cis-trans isomerase [Candidimonas nitroreducens]|uniref:Maleate cis-trans isomerase n=2 Tax=Candidimonas nitroreducens TaxID=683354 RepID=A0A225MZ55_9BURK|nr:maleate cis-trans isomerase [Candidimonas nitroreducens]